MNRPIVVFSAALVVLGGCKGFKEAMTAHVDVVASAGSQELSVDRLDSLLAQAKVPPNADMAKAVTDLWVNYQLLGQAAAHNDSLNDPKLVDAALWPVISQERVVKWHDQLTKTFPGIDTTNLASRYANGEMLAASHILFVVPQSATPAQRDSIRRKAEAVRAQVTAANFAQLAKTNSQDPGSAAHGGDLGVFPKGVMAKQFQDALLKLKPGEISPIVQTEFGYHIIRRPTFAEVKDEFSKEVNAAATQQADSTYLANLERTSDIKIKDDAVGTMRAASKDLDAHAKDDAVLGTSTAGNFTMAKLVHWISAYPQRAQIEHGLAQAPDSQVTGFLKNVMRNELVLHQADSAKVELDSSEMADLHGKFAGLVTAAWEGLNVSPKVLADSGKTESQRERVAAAHVEQYMDGLMTQRVRYVDVPIPLKSVVRDKYTWKVNQAGLARALAQAIKARAATDSVKAKNRPASAVPLGPPAPAPSAPQQPKG